MLQCQVAPAQALNVVQEALRPSAKRLESFVSALPGSPELLNDQVRVAMHSQVNLAWLQAVPARHCCANFVLANGQGINHALILRLVIGMLHSDKPANMNRRLLTTVDFGSLECCLRIGRRWRKGVANIHNGAGSGKAGVSSRSAIEMDHYNKVRSTKIMVKSRNMALGVVLSGICV